MGSSTLLWAATALVMATVQAKSIRPNVFTQTNTMYDPDVVTCYKCEYEVKTDGTDCCPQGAMNCQKTTDVQTQIYPACNAGIECDGEIGSSCYGTPKRPNVPADIVRVGSAGYVTKQDPYRHDKDNGILKWGQWGGACVVETETLQTDTPLRCYTCTAHQYSRTKDSPAHCPYGTKPACINTVTCTDGLSGSAHLCSPTVRALGVKGASQLDCVIENGNEPHMSPSPSPPGYPDPLSLATPLMVNKPKRYKNEYSADASMPDNVAYSTFNSVPTDHLSANYDTLPDSAAVPSGSYPSPVQDVVAAENPAPYATENDGSFVLPHTPTKSGAASMQKAMNAVQKQHDNNPPSANRHTTFR